MLISVLAIRRERKKEEKGKARASKKGRRSESYGGDQGIVGWISTLEVRIFVLN